MPLRNKLDVFGLSRCHTTTAAAISVALIRRRPLQFPAHYER